MSLDFKQKIMKNIASQYPNVYNNLPQYQQTTFQYSTGQLLDYQIIQQSKLQQLFQTPPKSLPNEPYYKRLKYTLTVFVGIIQHNQVVYKKIIQSKQYTFDPLIVLKKLVEEATYTVDCKSRMKQYLESNVQKIFCPLPHIQQKSEETYAVHTIKQGVYQTITEQQYYILYEETLQLLLTIINSVNHLQSLKYSTLEHNIRTLIAFVLLSVNTMCKIRFDQKQSARKMHMALTKAVIRNYYICFKVKKEVIQFNEQMQKEQIDKIFVEKVVKKIQAIEKYITEEEQRIFKKISARKLSKRLVMLEQCKNNINNIFTRGNFNKENQKKNKLKTITQIIKNKIKNNPKNDEQFYERFQQIQNAFLLSEESFIETGFSVQQMLVSFQKILLSNYIYSKDGNRKQIEIKNASRGQSKYSKSRSSIRSNNIENEVLLIIRTLNLQYANQFNDAVNFNIAQLKRLSSIILQQFSQLSQPIANFLQFLPILIPQYSKQFFQTILFPLTKDFLSLPDKLNQYQKRISMLNLTLPTFMHFRSLRLKLIHTIQSNLTNFTKIYNTLIQLQTDSLEATAKQTAETILLLLLAEKELNAYMMEATDFDESVSSRGLQYLKQCFYEPLLRYVHGVVCGQSLRLLLDNVEFFNKLKLNTDRLVQSFFERASKCKKKLQISKLYEEDSKYFISLVDKAKERIKVEPCAAINYKKVDQCVALLKQIQSVCRDGDKNNEINTEKGKEFKKIFFEKL